MTVVICANNKSSKELTHKLFLLDEDTNTCETFLIDSPETPRTNSPVPATPASSSSSLETGSERNISPALSDDFLKELDQLNENFQMLSPIPVVHTPRVTGEKNSCQPDFATPGPTDVNPSEQRASPESSTINFAIFSQYTSLTVPHKDRKPTKDKADQGQEQAGWEHGKT